MARGFTSIDSKKAILDDSFLDERIIYPKKFWCYSPKSKEKQCCFWHQMFYPYGGPERNGVFHPIYEYETELLKCLERGDKDLAYRLIAVYKSTGLGITEFFVLWIIWKCLTDPWFHRKHVVVVTGPGHDLGKKIIDRFKKFCDKGYIEYVDHGVNSLNINGCPIEAFPSNNIDAARGLPRVSVFFGDEAAFFNARRTNDRPVQKVGERYMAKGGAFTIWVSTPGESIECFFYELYKNPGKYKKFEFYEEWGLRKDPITNTSIYDEKEVELARTLPSYPMEYLGQWGVNVGDIYSQTALDIITGEEYTINPSDMSMNRKGFIDAGFGTSNFGLVICEKRNNMPYVIFAKDYTRKSFTEMLDEIEKLSNMFHVRNWGSDAANPEVIKDMRDKLHLNVTGFAFNKFGKLMTAYASEAVGNLKCRIHPQFERLISQLETIRYKKTGQPDKNIANPFDLGDAFQGCLWLFKHGDGYISFIK